MRAPVVSTWIGRFASYWPSGERAMRGVTCLAMGLWVATATAQMPPEDVRQAYPIPESVRVVRDVVYAQYDARTLKLDLYLPADTATRDAIPAIVVVRGGGWQSGDKQSFGFIAGQLAKVGFVAASIEYRTSQEAKFPAAVHDVKAAVRWLRAHANEHRVNPNAIGAIGGSAGAHLVAMLATSGDMPGLEGEGGNATTSSRVQAVVAMACVCNMELANSSVQAFLGTPLEAATVKLASPVTHVDRRAAPILLLHSETDRVVPFGQSVEMQRRYASFDAHAELRVIDAPGMHPFWNSIDHFEPTMRHVIEFFGRTLQ